MKKQYSTPSVEVAYVAEENFLEVSALSVNSDKELNSEDILAPEDQAWNIWE